ncbi:MAG TPA: phosphoribosylformylglycinamidine synthase subunit PurS [Candidatus Methanomethylophilaceae archaeon]|nr:phosphoribosylformylglycinamidine synthase subunit PurS [Candidatus Methanomethylophilaceae archaeon]
MTIIEIRIRLKKGVADPEGKNVKKTLEALGFETGEVKTEKVYEIEMDGSEQEALVEGRLMCEKLLVNPVIHDYEITVR